MADPLTSFAGISSGIDSRALVEQIMLLERRPAVRLENTIEANKKKTAAFEQFRTLLATLKTAADGFKLGTGLSALSTTAAGSDSAGRSLVAATAAAGAAPGVYQIEVQTLAKAQKTIGTAQASATDPLALAGTVAMSVGGVEVGQLTIEATDTLATIRDKINALGGSSPKVQATILSAGTADQRLVLNGLQVGSTGAFAFADVSGTVAASLGLNNAPYQPATDASFLIDGVPMTRTSNVVTDAIANVTLTLSAAEIGKTATVTVERFPSAATEAAKGFVEAYNKVVAFVQAQSNAGADGSMPPLRGDGLLRTVRGALTAAVTGVAADAPVDMARLATVGISLQKDGTLAFEADTFKTAYNTRRDDLVSLFEDRGTALYDVLDSLTMSGTGAIDQRVAMLSERNSALGDRVTDIDTRLEKRRASLLAQYAKFEASLGRMKSIGDALASQLAGLPKASDD